LLELKVRMAYESLTREAVRRDGDEGGDGDRRGAVPVLPFPPPQSLLQPTPMEYAFSTRPCYISPFDPCNSNPPPIPVLEVNDLPVVMRDPTRGRHYAPTSNGSGSSWTPDPVAGPSLSRTLPVSHGVDPNSAYNSAPLQYWDHYRESHILQNPQGCRWHYCSVCRGGGERATGFE